VRHEHEVQRRGPLESGHHMAEDAPEALAAALVPFLAM
jgi:hypothetical protein